MVSMLWLDQASSSVATSWHVQLACAPLVVLELESSLHVLKDLWVCAERDLNLDTRVQRYRSLTLALSG